MLFRSTNFLFFILYIKNGNNRVKAIDTLQIALPPIQTSPRPRTSTTLVSTISSDGRVRLYDLAAVPEVSKESVDKESVDKESVEVEPVTTYDSKGSRLTCVAMADGDGDGVGSLNGKRKRVEEGEDESESESESEVT